MTWLIVGLLILAIALLIALLLRRGGGDAAGVRAALAESESRLRLEQQAALAAQLTPVGAALTRVEAGIAEGREATLRKQGEALAEQMASLQKRIDEALRVAREEQAAALRAAREEQGKNLEALGGKVELKLTAILTDNEKKLEQMRQTVDEKLQSTLEKNITARFSQVSALLEGVQRGLGEMQTLAQDVGGLKKVLSGVKTRGILGEAQLGALLEQFLAPDQYAANVKVRPRSEAVVEFAVKLPGPDPDSRVWLPIDAKFPVEDYQRLSEAYERGDLAALEESGKALEARILGQARDIRDKYIAPPATTDFAILFLPFEGLYAEVLRRPGLFERVQRECRVTLVGPTTLTAFLNSLQVGFRTLAISKQSSEVWKLLGKVKTEFGRFGESLSAVQKKLDEASSKLSEVGQRRDRMLKDLGKLESHPELEEAPKPLALLPGGGSDPGPDAE